MVWDDTLRTSAIFQCTMSPAGISNVRLVPVYINSDFRPKPAEGAHAESILARLDALSREIPVELPKDLEQVTARYLLDADQANQSIRRKSHLFFLRNTWRYPKKILWQQVRTYARNRIHELRQSDPGSVAPRE
jgi:hypothetical protein